MKEEEDEGDIKRITPYSLGFWPRPIFGVLDLVLNI